jgi:transposase
VINSNTSAVWTRGEICSSRRRRWSEADKGRIVAESFEPGVTTSDVARRHDLSPQQLFQWRRQARQGGLVVPVTDDMTFADVQIEPVIAALGIPGGEGLDLTVAGASIRVTAKTDLALLARVVRALADGRA